MYYARFSIVLNLLELFYTHGTIRVICEWHLNNNKMLKQAHYFVYHTLCLLSYDTDTFYVELKFQIGIPSVLFFFFFFFFFFFYRNTNKTIFHAIFAPILS